MKNSSAPSPAVSIVPLRAFRDNYIWCLHNGRDAAVVDPGDAAPVLEFVQQAGLQLRAIICTHHHADHVGGNAALLAKYSAAVFGPAHENIPGVTQSVREGDRIFIESLGLEFYVIDIPGHTAGHVAYFGARMLFCGDTLFSCGCGRVFEGTPQQMVESLHKLADLPLDTQVYCGHEYTLANIHFALTAEADNSALIARRDEVEALRAQGIPSLPSTIGAELSMNPFLRAHLPALAASASQHKGLPLRSEVDVFTALRAWKNSFS
jgi:hydroxyacylglutathione hydrolase